MKKTLAEIWTGRTGATEDDVSFITPWQAEQEASDRGLLTALTTALTTAGYDDDWDRFVRIERNSSLTDQILNAVGLTTDEQKRDFFAKAKARGA